MQPLSNVERLRKLNALLDEALDLPAEQHDAWLAQLPAEHQPLMPELRMLLARAHVETGSFMGRGAHALLDAQALSAEVPEARASVANALSNLEATLNGDHRLIAEGRELVAELE